MGRRGHYAHRPTRARCSQRRRRLRPAASAARGRDRSKTAAPRAAWPQSWMTPRRCRDLSACVPRRPNRQFARENQARAGLFPLLTVRLTLAPCLSRLWGLGFWEITRPFLILIEKARLILPTEQSCALIARLAAFRRLPLSLGTVQSLRKEAVTEWAAVIATTQPALPVQSSVQPAKDEPVAAVAASVTDVP